MNKAKLFISVGICGVLFSGCWFFGTESKQQERQVVLPKIEPCDKMPDELETQLDKMVEKYKDNDWLYDKPIQEKKYWTEYFTGKRYASDKRNAVICEILEESWNKVKDYTYSSIVGYEYTKEKYEGPIEKYKGTIVNVKKAKTVEKRCLDDLDLNAAEDSKRSCYNSIRGSFKMRYDRLYKQKIEDVFGY